MTAKRSSDTRSPGDRRIQGCRDALCKTPRRARSQDDLERGRPVKTSLLQPHPRTRRSSTGPLTDDAKTRQGIKNVRQVSAGDPHGPRSPPIALPPKVKSNVVSLHDVRSFPPHAPRHPVIGPEWWGTGRNPSLFYGRTKLSSVGARSTIGPAPAKDGGARRDRTDDLMLAKHALSQLSYCPTMRKARSRSAAP